VNIQDTRIEKGTFAWGKVTTLKCKATGAVMAELVGSCTHRQCFAAWVRGQQDIAKRGAAANTVEVGHGK
jgi:hypothetical protein